MHAGLRASITMMRQLLGLVYNSSVSLLFVFHCNRQQYRAKSDAHGSSSSSLTASSRRKFVDRVRIQVAGGHGGKGVQSFESKRFQCPQSSSTGFCN